MSQPINLAASGVISAKKSGRIRGIFVTAASGTPTITVHQGALGASGTPASAVKATQVLTLTGDITAGEKVTVGKVNPTTYTFVDALSSPAKAYEVLIGASAAAALDNLKSAINASAGEGTTYGTGTVAHPEVTATTNTDTEQTVEARSAGPLGNEISVSETLAAGSWGAATLAGGLGAVTVLIPTFTPVAGTVYPFPGTGVDFVDGCRFTKGGTTVEATFLVDNGEI